MIIVTGDIHGDASRIQDFSEWRGLQKEDIIIILGDVGVNYCLDSRDGKKKQILSRLKPTIFCIHGNHEQRPQLIEGYIRKEWNGGAVWYQKEYPNLLFAEDGSVFSMDGHRFLVIGGAYSVDKYYRLERGYGWWESEQPTDEIKRRVERSIAENKDIDIVLSHTCPFKYEPREMFLPMIDQNTVDTSTEEWLDTIEESLDYKTWYCGHWHTDKKIDRMIFLYKSFLEILPRYEIETGIRNGLSM